MTHNRNPRPSFSEYIQNQKPRLLSDWWMYTLGGTPVTDFIIRFEHLQEDLSEVSKKLNLGPVDVTSITEKSGTRKDRRPYSELYTSKDKELIERVCRNELDAYGYQFEKA